MYDHKQKVRKINNFFSALVRVKRTKAERCFTGKDASEDKVIGG